MKKFIPLLLLPFAALLSTNLHAQTAQPQPAAIKQAAPIQKNTTAPKATAPKATAPKATVSKAATLPAPVKASKWSVRAGVISITPQVTSGDLSAPSLPNTQTDVGSSTQLGGGINYQYNDQLAIDVPLALPFKHDISGAGAIAGVGKLGDIEALPVTVLAQWRFLSTTSAFRPYVGAGLTYAAFFGGKSTSTLTAISGGTTSNPTTLKVESKLAPTIQVGASYAFNPRWFLDASYSYTDLKTTTTLSTGQTIETVLNPATLSIAVGYRFK